MKKARRQIEHNFKAPFLGMGVIVASSICFLLMLSIIIILTRLALG